MKQNNLDSLADGIFAIVMTLLVFEIRIPDIHGFVTNEQLWQAIVNNAPLFLSYILSFSLLFTYWRSYHLIASTYAKNTDFTMTNISGLFFFLIALAPFSSRLLGHYSETQIAVFVFAANIIAISLTLYFMRRYAAHSNTIENEQISKQEDHRAYTRILFPVFCSLVALITCYFSIKLSLTLLTIGIIFNLFKGSTRIIFNVINPLIGRTLG